MSNNWTIKCTIVTFHLLLPGVFELVQHLSEATSFEALMMRCRSADGHDVVCSVCTGISGYSHQLVQYIC